MPKTGTALISVTDKSKLEVFKRLTDMGWKIISTGGTGNALCKLGIPIVPIEHVTGLPEMLDGRLKTLHSNIFGAILADRSQPHHMMSLIEHDIEPIHMVVVNLYDFERNPGIENIDIGGPSLLRAAAKNADSVTVLCDPSDYEAVIKEMEENEGETLLSTRRELQRKVFRLTGRYDIAISQWLNTDYSI